MRLRLLGSMLLAALAPVPALAHPHVWITASAEIVYAPDGKVEAVRHRWTFDRAYSAFATQGLEKDAEGRIGPGPLADLARENTESLADSEYFTLLKADGQKQAFDAPREPAMVLENGQAVLSFLLPLKTPAPSKLAVTFEVYDPTYFVSFSLAEGDDVVRLANAPKGCAVTVKRSKPQDTAAGGQKLSEAFFSALTASSEFGAQFSNRALVACP